MADKRERDTERTTIVSDSDRGSNRGVVLLVGLVVIVLAVLFFAGAFDRRDEQLNVEVNTPDVNVIVPPQTEILPPPSVITVPETQVPPPPDVNVNVTTPPADVPADEPGNTDNALANSG